MDNSKENLTLEILLERERKEILKYLSENMEEILSGTEKILKVCTDEPRTKFKEPIAKEEAETTTRIFPTSIITHEYQFPGASFIKFDSQSSILSMSNCVISDDSD